MVFFQKIISILFLFLIFPYSKAMLRTNPSRVELKQDDLTEYEQMKVEWKKELQRNGNNNENKSQNIFHDSSEKNHQKNERHTRMGYVTKK